MGKYKLTIEVDSTIELMILSEVAEMLTLDRFENSAYFLDAFDYLMTELLRGKTFANCDTQEVLKMLRAQAQNINNFADRMEEAET